MIGLEEEIENLPHHECCKVRNMDLGGHICDGGVYDEPNKSEGKAKNDERRPEAGKIGHEC